MDDLPTCNLCLEERPLQNSHVIPKGIYRILAQASSRVRDNPVLVDIQRQTALQTSNQLKSPLLCNECEQLLAQGPENDIIPLLCKMNGGFALRDRITTVNPEGQIDGKLVWSNDVLGNTLDLGQFCKFILSIYWRCSIADLRLLSPYHGKLGSKFGALVKNFLLQDTVPSMMSLQVHFHLQEEPCVFVSLPSRRRERYMGRDFFNHRLVLPGLLIDLMVGGPTSLHARVPTKNREMQVLFYGCNLFENDSFRDLISQLSEAKSSKNLGGC